MGSNAIYCCSACSVFFPESLHRTVLDGSLFLNQKMPAYNCLIVLIDSAMSFPFVYQLRALTAKNITEGLIKTRSLSGVPEAVIWENASP